MNTCSNCRYLESVTNSLIIGNKSNICKRYPPEGFAVPVQSGVNVGLQFIFQHPQTKPDDWCGEWKETVNPLGDQGGTT